MVGAQSASHGERHDYEPGSPHLRHATLRGAVDARLRELVRATTTADGCRVLEVGAGHGTFTDVLLDAGARVTVSEVSEASAELLRRRYEADDRVHVVHDATGEESLAIDEQWSAVVMISVLHHIPDYSAWVRGAADRIQPGGGFLSIQDPIWYARRTRAAHVASRAAYFGWRLFQGEVRRGLATRARRARGVWSDTEPSDLVEYHVVRQGVDEQALHDLLADRFAHVDLFRYWSTQSPLGQRVGDRVGWETDFGLMALGRRPIE